MGCPVKSILLTALLTVALMASGGFQIREKPLAVAECTVFKTNTGK